MTEVEAFESGALTADPIVVERIGDRLTINRRRQVVLRLRLEQGLEPLLIREQDEGGAAPTACLPWLMAAVEMLSSTRSDADRISLDPQSLGFLADLLTARGIATGGRNGALTIHSGMAWQDPEPWLGLCETRAYPLRYVVTVGRRHPQRPPKPSGIFYERFIPWLGKPIRFRAATMADLQILSDWMNSPRVHAVWGLAGSREQHERYLATVTRDSHRIPSIGLIGDDAFGYFEIYWAKEDRLAPFYDARDYDRGWHVLVGDERFRGKPYVSAWLPSLMHALFLDDPRTDRIVGEPGADHRQQIRNLERSGFATIKTVEFPNKRAALVMLLRERFFEDKLWRPAADDRG